MIRHSLHAESSDTTTPPSGSVAGGPRKFKRMIARWSPQFVPESLEPRRLLSTSIWSQSASLPTARGDAAAINTASGVLVFGGGSGGNTLDTVSLLDPNSKLAASSWSAMNGPLTGLGLGQSTATDSSGNQTDVQLSKYGGDIFIYGGTGNTQPTAGVTNYVNQNNNTETINAPSMHSARSYFAHASDPATGDLYAIGGLSTSNVNSALSSAEVYTPPTDSWSLIAPLPVALSGASAAADGAGHIFVFGGQTAAGALVKTIYRYTIATNTWTTAAATLPVAVTDATAVYGAYGTIYIAGGKVATGAVTNFEVYNPVYDSTTPEPSLPTAVYGAAGVVDANNNLDLIGGFGSTGTALKAIESTPAVYNVSGLPQPPVLSVPAVESVYDGTPQAVDPTAVGTDGVTPVDGTFTVTYNGSKTVPVNAGTYAVIVQFTSADAGYVSYAADSSVTIDAATPAITVTGGGNFLYSGQPHPITASVVGIDGITAVAGSIAYTYNGSPTAPTNSGTYTAVATFTPTDPNYTAASASTTITIPDPTIPTGVTVTGTTTTSLTVSWNPATLPDGATPSYDVLERKVLAGGGGKGSHPGTTIYVAVGTVTNGDSLTIGGLATAGPVSGYHTYVVESIDNSTATPTYSPYSTAVTGSPLFAPSFAYTLDGGALVSQASVEVGTTIQITASFYGNASPNYSLIGAPSTMSINASTGVITYSPVAGESGTVPITIVATNSLGTASANFTFVILQRPRVVVTGGSFAYDGNVHAATAVAYGTDGQPISGTFSFVYGQYGSTSPYAEAGTYPVTATFYSSTPGYGGATGTGSITITALPATISVANSIYLADGNPHPALATATAPDTGSIVPGTFSYTYNGSATVPTVPGTYAVVATFTSNQTWAYADSSGTGTLVLEAATSTQPLALPGPADYVKTDPDGISLDIWSNGTGTGPMTDQVGGSAFNAINGSGTSLIVDLTYGGNLPSSGVTFTGTGPAAADTLSVIGSVYGDTIAASAGRISVNGNAVNYNNIGNVDLTVGQGVNSLAVNGGALNLVESATSYSINIDTFSTVAIGTGATLVVQNPSLYGLHAAIDTNSLSIAGSTGHWTGLMDLGYNSLVVESGDLATLTNQIAQGYNLTGGADWLGTGGITSSTAAANSDHQTALGVIPNTINGAELYGVSGAVFDSFDHVQPDAGAVLIKYTSVGDANLDGVVDGSDYSLIDAAHATAVTGWYNGDFNYAGSIDGSDYALIDNTFNNQTTTSNGAPAAVAAAQVSAAQAPVTPAVIKIVQKPEHTARVFFSQALFQSQNTITPATFLQPLAPGELMKAKKDLLDMIYS